MLVGHAASGPEERSLMTASDVIHDVLGGYVGVKLHSDSTQP